MDVNAENVFKAQSYRSASWRLEKSQEQLESLNLDELEGLEGVGKSIAQVIHDLNTKGEFETLNKLLSDIPSGVVLFLDIPGIGPKKIGQLWRELGVESIPELKKACQQDRVAKLKGFGKKIQTNILKALDQQDQNQGKYHLHHAESLIEPLQERLILEFGSEWVSAAGEWRRKMEVITRVDFVIGHDNPVSGIKKLASWPELDQDEKLSSPRCFRGRFHDANLCVSLWFTSKNSFGSQLLKHSGAVEHLAHRLESGLNLFQILSTTVASSEAKVYEAAGLPWIPPELREGRHEFEMVQQKDLPELLEYKDLKGVLHAHSTYSDGKNSLAEMAQKCIDLGFQYLGISDHSVSAVYANGLAESRIDQQHEEIDRLNEKLAPFKIFKGIEADILAEGKLDYENQVLEKFDFIIASIHSQTNMDQDKATRRVLNAISNPFTTLMGHITGRLLLRRPGFPLDMERILSACAENNVVIEINAHPYRLDLDWRWVYQAIGCGVRISINPDAHQIGTLEMMKYGVFVGRKGGLSADSTLNCLSVEQLDSFFRNRKAKILT